MNANCKEEINNPYAYKRAKDRYSRMADI